MKNRSVDELVVAIFTFIVCVAPIAMVLLVLVGAI